MPQLKNLHKLLDPEIRDKNIRALLQWSRGKYWDLSGQTMPDPVFLIGCSRSGTTMSYETLAASPELVSIGYELPQFWDNLYGPHHNNWASEAAGADDAKSEHREAFFRYMYARLPQGRMLDKSCVNVLRIPYLYQLFPNAHFVYLYRDGRANVSSLIDGWRNNGHFSLAKFLGKFPVEVAIKDPGHNNKVHHDWSFFLPPNWRDYNQANLEQVCAFQWVSANQSAIAARSLIPEHQWTEIRYEDLVDQPVATFRNVFDRLGLTFSQDIEALCANLAERPTSLVSGSPDRDKWKKRNFNAVQRVMDQLEPLLTRLGYDV